MALRSNYFLQYIHSHVGLNFLRKVSIKLKLCCHRWLLHLKFVLICSVLLSCPRPRLLSLGLVHKWRHCPWRRGSRIKASVKKGRESKIAQIRWHHLRTIFQIYILNLLTTMSHRLSDMFILSSKRILEPIQCFLSLNKSIAFGREKNDSDSKT